MFFHVICDEIEPEEERYGKNTLCKICKINQRDQKRQRDEAKKGLEKQAK